MKILRSERFYGLFILLLMLMTANLAQSFPRPWMNLGKPGESKEDFTKRMHREIVNEIPDVRPEEIEYAIGETNKVRFFGEEGLNENLKGLSDEAMVISFIKGIRAFLPKMLKFAEENRANIEHGKTVDDLLSDLGIGKPENEFAPISEKDKELLLLPPVFIPEKTDIPRGPEFFPSSDIKPVIETVEGIPEFAKPQIFVFPISNYSPPTIEFIPAIPDRLMQPTTFEGIDENGNPILLNIPIDPEILREINTHYEPMHIEPPEWVKYADYVLLGIGGVAVACVAWEAAAGYGLFTVATANSYQLSAITASVVGFFLMNESATEYEDEERKCTRNEKIIKCTETK